MAKKFKKKYDPLVDTIEPFYIDNFLHLRSAVCKELLKEAATFLKSHGWEYDFAMYYHDTKEKVRLYLRIGYVGSIFLDGSWEEIKIQLPSLIPLIILTMEIRKYKNLGLKWIEPNLKLLEWVNFNNHCISCETYLSGTSISYSRKNNISVS